MLCRCSVKINDLSIKLEEHTILDSVSLEANHGEILTLIGRNGSGKTTLVRAVLKRIAYKGRIDFFDCHGKKIDDPKIGYVPQKLFFKKNTPMTVLDFFCMNLTNFPVWLFHRKTEKVSKILEKTESSELINKSIGSLSGGELQKVLLAFALEPMPDILILDEPSAALDHKSSDFFYSLITSLRSEFHMPIILVSHDLSQVRKFATKYAILEKGRILETGDAKSLSKDFLSKKYSALES